MRREQCAGSDDAFALLLALEHRRFSRTVENVWE